MLARKFLLLIVPIFSASCTLQEVDPEESTTTIAETTTTPPPSAPPSTLPPTVSLSGLPTVLNPEGDQDSIAVMQRLLTATCCERGDDGIWGEKTQESIDELRLSLGLDLGGLDDDLWNAVFETDYEELEPVNSEIAGVNVPKRAVLLEADSEERIFDYTIAGNSDLESITEWYNEIHLGNNLSNWYWCAHDTGRAKHEYWWWKKESATRGQVLKLIVRDLGMGRVDLKLLETQGPLVGCEGYVAPPTTTIPVRGSSDIEITYDQYRYQDAGLNWQWRPVGKYRNTSGSRIIYSEVIWRIKDLDTYTSASYFESIETEIPAGGSISIMNGRWFTLKITNLDHSIIGLSLGSGSISITPEVRYIMYDDYTTWGTPA